MRAVRFHEYGPVDVLRVEDVPDPVATAGEVVVVVRAAGINPGEISIRTGAMHDRWPAHFPEGQGSDFAGVIEQVGSDVDAFAIGDEVAGFTNGRASHAEKVVVPADQVVPKPAHVAWSAAGALFVAGTSAHALCQALPVGPDDVVVVTAAAGGVGSLACQLAGIAGATVIGLATPTHHDWLRSHGVRPVDYRADDLTTAIRDASPDAPITAMLDTFGGGYVQRGLELDIPPSRVATIADFAAGEVGAQVVSHSVSATEVVMHGLLGLVADGRLEVPIQATYPLTEVRAAYTQLATRHGLGKIVLTP